MKSRFLSRIESDIRGAPHAIAADCLRCERAAYLARLGDFDNASREIAAVRAGRSASSSIAISAWINLAEGLLAHYSNLSPHARDKIARSHALSSAAGLKPLQALGAAWLAHLDYLQMDAYATARRAHEALTLAQPGHHAALARAKLVIAQSYHEGGRYDLARPWYEQARHHAAADGDNATVSAMMWNMASLHVALGRQHEVSRPAAAPLDRQALLSVESTHHFDTMLGVQSLRSLHPILRAQTYVLLGRTEEALGLFETHLAEAVDQGMGSVEGVLLADRAWCRALAGKVDAARDDAEAAATCLSHPGSHCDRAPGHSRLAQVYVALGETGLAQRQRELATTRWAGHERDQLNLVDALDRTFATVTI